MGWFKRNLFFAIGVIVAVGLLGAACFYVYQSYQRNNAALEKWTEFNKQLKNNTVTWNGHAYSPGNNATNNVQIARDEEGQLRQWISQATNYFDSIASIPKRGSPLSDQTFAGALHATLDQLKSEAAAANVTLPPDFAFSFTVQNTRVTFAPGSLERLSVQLGEVKSISEILFAAGINALDGFQRMRVSSDDQGAGALPTDYLDDQQLTADLGVLTPYQVTFRGFSPEIARVLAGFAASPHGFIVKTISVQPATATGASYADQFAPTMTPGMATYMRAAGMAPATATPQSAQGGLQSGLNEHLLNVTLKVEVVKLAPKN